MAWAHLFVVKVCQCLWCNKLSSMPFFMRKRYSLLFLANLLFYSIVNQSINWISLFGNALPALGCNWQRQCTFLNKQYKFKSLCIQKRVLSRSVVIAIVQIEIINWKTANNNEKMKYYKTIKVTLILAFITLIICWLYGSDAFI